ncbi:hypothetical protein Tco_0626106 [Tanacetum coccineum]|uniref:Uncharacterized protein n=1 Tax=Tanacetum coccineum TaxID=301880 RepID=A0ABQ4WIN5_9ASTR
MVNGGKPPVYHREPRQTTVAPPPDHRSTTTRPPVNHRLMVVDRQSTMTLNNSRPLPDFEEYAASTSADTYRFRVPPDPFNYATRRLTMEEILAELIDKGKREHEEMEIFIKEFRATNELLLKERSNLLSELKIKVNELLKVMGNVLIPKNKVNGVTTRGRKMTSEATRNKEINETGINKNGPPRFEQDV